MESKNADSIGPEGKTQLCGQVGNSWWRRSSYSSEMVYLKPFEFTSHKAFISTSKSIKQGCHPIQPYHRISQAVVRLQVLNLTCQTKNASCSSTHKSPPGQCTCTCGRDSQREQIPPWVDEVFGTSLTKKVQTYSLKDYLKPQTYPNLIIHPRKKYMNSKISATTSQQDYPLSRAFLAFRWSCCVIGGRSSFSGLLYHPRARCFVRGQSSGRICFTAQVDSM